MTSKQTTKSLSRTSRVDDSISLRRREVLVVEPDKLTEWSLRTYLSKWFSVHSTNSTDNAELVLRIHPVDVLVISDELPSAALTALEQIARQINPQVSIVQTLTDPEAPAGSIANGSTSKNLSRLPIWRACSVSPRKNSRPNSRQNLARVSVPAQLVCYSIQEQSKKNPTRIEIPVGLLIERIRRAGASGFDYARGRSLTQFILSILGEPHVIPYHTFDFVIRNHPPDILAAGVTNHGGRDSGADLAELFCFREEPPGFQLFVGDAIRQGSSRRQEHRIRDGGCF